MDEKRLNEAEICDAFITPAIIRAGWDQRMQIRREYPFTDGRVIVRGKLGSRGKKKQADYLLCYQPNLPLAVVEAKDNRHPVGGGMQQALGYAEALDVPFVFSSNGDAFLFHDRTGQSSSIEKQIGLDEFPSPDELWRRYRAWKGLNGVANKLARQPYADLADKESLGTISALPFSGQSKPLHGDSIGCCWSWPPAPARPFSVFQIIWRLWKAEKVKHQRDMDQVLVLNERTRRVAEKVVSYLLETDPYGKTMVFCEDIDHAERMRSALVNEVAKRMPEEAENVSKFVVRITGDSDEGRLALDDFIHPERRYPVIATTSKLLTTGVDVRTCKLIVLDQRIESLIEFKQIIGRGTRIHEDAGKFWFTIMDFKRATERFADPDFDGEPVLVYEPDSGDSIASDVAEDQGDDGNAPAAHRPEVRPGTSSVGSRSLSSPSASSTSTGTVGSSPSP